MTADQINAICRVNAKHLLEAGFGQKAATELSAQLRTQLYAAAGLAAPSVAIPSLETTYEQNIARMIFGVHRGD